jgi:hypothetical protein
MGVKGDVTIAGDDTVGVDDPAAVVASPALTLSNAGEATAIHFYPLLDFNLSTRTGHVPPKQKQKQNKKYSNNWSCVQPQCHGGTWWC